MKRDLFITFEGGEGAGKTTQIKRLAAALPGCIVTREPGGTPEAEALRNLFITHQGQNWPLEAQLLLMSSARNLHTEKTIKPALAQGKIVLCDRYYDSTMVYQGIAGGMAQDKIEAVTKIAIGDFEPDITFILDINPEEGLKRAGTRGGDAATFEAKDIVFHMAIRNGFLQIAKKNSERCVIIDASQNEDVIAEQILAKVQQTI